MLLTFNIGNRVISLGFVKDGQVAARVSLSADKARTADEYALSLLSLLALHGLEKENFRGAIGSSVFPALTETVCHAIATVFSIRPHVLVATAVGALTKYKGPMLLVDFGTAITFSAISAENSFLGCAIAPGLALSSASLAEAAALLPDVSAKVPACAIGKNTAESLQSGRIFGIAAMVDGMIARMRTEMNADAAVILTGHSALTVKPYLSTECEYAEDLLFLGLAAIYEKNERKKKG